MQLAINVTLLLDFNLLIWLFEIALGAWSNL